MGSEQIGANTSVPAWINKTQETVDAWRQQIGSDIGATVDSLKTPSADKWSARFDGIQSDANAAAKKMADAKPMAALEGDFEQNGAKIEGILAELQKQVDTFGLSEAQKKALELKSLGADTTDIDKANALAKTLDNLTQQKKITEEIAKLQKETHRPD